MLSRSIIPSIKGPRTCLDETVFFGETLLLERGDADVPVSHRAVISLKHDGAGCCLTPSYPGRCRSFHFDVLVEDLAIEFHDQKFGICGLLSVSIKLGG